MCQFLCHKIWIWVIGFLRLWIPIRDCSSCMNILIPDFRKYFKNATSSDMKLLRLLYCIHLHLYRINTIQRFQKPKVLTPCTCVTRGDWFQVHHVGGQLGFLCVLTPRRLKCKLHCITHGIEKKLHYKWKRTVKLPTSMVHFRVFWWWRQVKWVNTWTLPLRKIRKQYYFLLGLTGGAITSRSEILLRISSVNSVRWCLRDLMKRPKRYAVLLRMVGWQCLSPLSPRKAIKTSGMCWGSQLKNFSYLAIVSKTCSETRKSGVQFHRAAKHTIIW